MKTETQIIIGSAIFIIVFGIMSSVIVSASRARAESLADNFTGSWACTADAEMCPDGSQVGRVPPYCQFASCNE